jgi:deoxyribose-phosphate aldolase
MDFAKYIDHTILKPEASEADIRKLCAEALEYHFATAFVNPCWVELAASLLKGSDVNVGVAIGFPLGAHTTASKVFQTKEAIALGALESDMVINIGAIKSGNWDLVKADIAAVVEAAWENLGTTPEFPAPSSARGNSRGQSLGVKVILETCLLTNDEKVRAALTAKEAGAAFVKTSTGFSTGGATVEDVRLLRRTVGSEMGVKASGGIRDFAAARAMIDAGATRVGTSAGVKIMQDYLASLKHG